MINKTAIRSRIKAAVDAVAPSAKVYLYGSRARGDAREDSDWDIIVLLPHGQKHILEDEIRSQVFDIMLDTGEIISTFVYTQDEWDMPMRKATPFYQNICREGVQL
jgi:predicted nucleotidyltransferase